MISATEAVQPFPESGALKRNMNVSLKLLQSILRHEGGEVYGYIVDTVRYANKAFEQTGSAPNFQGGVVTLATCKHQMRSGLSADAWRGSWVAGFAGVGAIPGHHINYLVYLMKVKSAYWSHCDLWESLAEETRLAKAADLQRLGDLYRPIADVGGPFDPRSYEPPRPDHAHCNTYQWQEDIDFSSVYGTRPPLLVGDAAFSFLWNIPQLAFPGVVHARTKKHDLTQVLAQLVNRPIREYV